MAYVNIPDEAPLMCGEWRKVEAAGGEPVIALGLDLPGGVYRLLVDLAHHKNVPVETLAADCLLAGLETRAYVDYRERYLQAVNNGDLPVKGGKHGA